MQCRDGLSLGVNALAELEVHRLTSLLLYRGS